MKRFDATGGTISAVTLKGHPLEGWRYWRVFKIADNDIVIETGAVDRAHPGPLNYVGFYVLKGTQLRCWSDYLRYVQRSLGAHVGSNVQYNIPQGMWDYDKNYVLNNVCQAQWCD